MITIKTKEEIKIMLEGGKILAHIMKELAKRVKAGLSTKELDRVAETLIFSAKGGSALGGKSGIKCSFKGYQGFPVCLCTSINEQIVHGVPSDRTLKEGDIISLDLGIFYKGFHTDMALTVPVGKVSPETKKLIEITKKSLETGIKKVKPGNRIGDISRAIQKYVESNGFNVVRELCGHGIGRNIHEDPQILNSVSFDKVTVDKVRLIDDGAIEIKEGMVLCLEPMVSMGDWRIKKGKDGFAWQTKDDSLSCHFEHTIAVTENGCQILTK